MIRERAFLKDYHAGRNADEASKLKWWILHQLTISPLNADQIYAQSKCGDIAMYLALHELVINGLVNGRSPYDSKVRAMRHDRMIYTLADNDAARFFSTQAEWMREDWKPEDWN